MHKKLISLPTVLGAAAFMLLPFVASSASDAPKTADYPTPGLYRVDMDATDQHNHGPNDATRIHTVHDDATGNITATRTRSGHGAPIIQKFAGTGPSTVCIPPQSVVATPLDGCIGKPLSAGAGGFPGAEFAGWKVNVSYKKIDEKTWEQKLSYTFNGYSGGLSDSTCQRRILAYQAKNAATTAERADAAKLLAEIVKQDAEMKKQAAALKAARVDNEDDPSSGPPSTNHGQPLQQGTVISRLTRIADKCTSSGK